jgi:L-histidine N-alpha-methyltransferase
MRLRARRRMCVRIPGAGMTLSLPRGAHIRTEISCKYTLPALAARAQGTGLGVERWFTGPEPLFGLALLRPVRR